MSISDAIILAFLAPTGITAIAVIGKNLFGTLRHEAKKDQLRAKSALLDFNLKPAGPNMAVRNKK